MFTSTSNNGECSGSGSNLVVHRNIKPIRRRESSLLTLASEEDDEVQFDSKLLFSFLLLKHAVCRYYYLLITLVAITPLLDTVIPK